MREEGTPASSIGLRPFRLALALGLSLYPLPSTVDPAFGQQALSPGEQTLMRALGDELQRGVLRLRLAGLEKPYFLSYTARSVRRVTLECAFGGLLVSSSRADRSLKVEVRVGEPSFDNTQYVPSDPWRFSPFTGDLPLEDDYDAIRSAAWLVTDKAYKAALERLAQKKAYKQTKMIAEELPDLSPEPATRMLLGRAEDAFDHASWGERLCSVSEVFRRQPGIQQSRVYVDVNVETRYYLDSEGREFRKPAEDIEVRFDAQTQAADGMEQSLSRRLLFRASSQIPPLEELRQEAQRLAASLVAKAKAPVLGEYAGPVLFEGEAAAEFFNQLLGHNVSSPRSLWVENDEDKKRFSPGALAGRLGLRVTAPLLDVFDDPTLAEADGIPLAGHYSVDDEGVPAQRATLVEQGRLRGLLMSRTPVKGIERSNGHARGGFWDIPTARVGNLIVSSTQAVPLSELRERLRWMARESGLEYALVVR